MITIIAVEGKSKLCNFKPKADFCCHHWADIHMYSLTSAFVRFLFLFGKGAIAYEN